ncbi:hypothetical protein [Natronomonas salina]|uniref:hypothetical protein n=1 Tax=Natronomonas salina TaxID=1710540 RepID=UPI001BAD96E1|nr:hypothetical protein [Natronomonas salina]
MWQDFIFLTGSIISIISLTPTLRSAVASVPWATSLPSAAIGLVYGGTYLSLGMTFSAAGSLAAGLMWSLILAFRRPTATESRSFLPTDTASDSI